LGRDSSNRPLVTDVQGRAQFTMWAIMSAPLLLSQNVRNLTAYQLETYLNPEVIAINQDPLGRQGQRLQGGNLGRGTANSPLTLQKCTKDPSQSWKWNVTAPFFLTNMPSKLCANVDDCGTDLIAFPCVTSGGTCAGPNSYANEQFHMMSSGQIKSALNGYCLTQRGLGYQVVIGPCYPTPSQVWNYDAANGSLQSGGGCLTLGGTLGANSNIWGRPLFDGSWAVAFVNVGSSTLNMNCDFHCLSTTGWGASQSLGVRDLWKRQTLPSRTAGEGIAAVVPGNGGIALFKLTPRWS